MVRISGQRVALRPFVFEDIPALTAIAEAPEVARWWGEPDERFPYTDKPDAARFTITLDATVLGLIEYGEKADPSYRWAWIDLFLDPAVHGRGHGTDALAAFVRYLTDELGHHRVTVDAAVDNAAAIRSYEKVGFKPVGILRSAWKDLDGTLRDVMLMDILASELHGSEPGASASQG